MDIRHVLFPRITLQKVMKASAHTIMLFHLTCICHFTMKEKTVSAMWFT